MFARLRLIHLRLAVVALYALAMASLGVMPQAGSAPRGPDLAAFTLPGDNAPVICLTGGAVGSDGAKAGPHPCAACVLMAAPGVVASPVVFVAGLGDVRPVVYALTTDRAGHRAAIRAVSRGPPAV
jgi:hypothetical protein